MRMQLETFIAWDRLLKIIFNMLEPWGSKKHLPLGEGSSHKHNNPGNDWEKIEYLLTLIRPSKDGEKIIDIMDIDRSESYSLINGGKIGIHKYSRRSDVAEFGTIKETLNYIYENLFISKGDNNE
jgi:hypothetical protein